MNVQPLHTAIQTPQKVKDRFPFSLQAGGDAGVKAEVKAEVTEDIHVKTEPVQVSLCAMFTDWSLGRSRALFASEEKKVRVGVWGGGCTK